jgi:hypothetical protein
MNQLFAEEKVVSPYVQAVNDARLVRTFGFIGLIGSIIACGPAVMIGVGAAVLGLGGTRYFRILGIIVAVLGGAGLLFAPFLASSAIALAAGILFAGMKVMTVLAREGKEDDDWAITRKRAITGIALSIVALVVGMVWLIYYSLVLTGMIIQKATGL